MLEHSANLRSGKFRETLNNSIDTTDFRGSHLMGDFDDGHGMKNWMIGTEFLSADFTD
jgi:hypothetical protein